MAKLLHRLAAAVGLASVSACAVAKSNWPALPATGFITGRAATTEDVKNGNAAFSMDGQSKGALPIIVPQYVWWSDDSGKKHPMILIQAEQAPDGSKIVGLRDFSGQETVATLPEIELLGIKKPN